MKENRRQELRELYRATLLENVIPFWQQYSPDREFGGYFNCLDRDGSVYGTDKAVWLQAREVWLFSRLYNQIEQKQSWLEMARLGYDFLTKYCYDQDGRMFFSVTRDGRPLRKRRYYYSETFGIMACAEYARAAGDEKALEMARSTLEMIIDLYRNPEKLPAKVIPETRSGRAHGVPMSILASIQVIRSHDSDPYYDQLADMLLEDILHFFVHPEEQALFEIVGPAGERLDSPDGRCINPGHAIEEAWFLLEEGCYRNDSSVSKQALQILDWSFELGWDQKYGGLLYFVDIEGKPLQQLEWDMKLWWPHTEALYALLLAEKLTADEQYEIKFDKLLKWVLEHFPDPEYGEWFGYLHRDGSVSHYLKGSMWKGAFHLPRSLLYSYLLLKDKS